MVRRLRTLTGFAVTALVACCGGACESPRRALPAPGTDARDGRPPPSAAGKPIPSDPGAGTAAPSLATVRVLGTGPGAIEIANDTDAPVGIEWDLRIEMETPGGWVARPTMVMQTECFGTPPPDRCVKLPPHGSFKPLPWLGWFGCTQCHTCRANVPAAPGRYRIVAVECGTGARHESPVIVVADEGRFAGTPHLRAPADDASAIVVANESDAPLGLQARIEVMRLDAARGAFDLTTDASMLLSPDCFPDAGACVTIPARGSLRTMGYRPGCARCAKCPLQAARPGTYQLRVTRCDHGETWDLKPFVVDATGQARAE